jgi:GT2 family glycosyltransferase
MKLSFAIPYYESDPGKRKVLEKCIRSLRGHDELIVVTGRQESMARAVNMCLEFSHGDYIIVSNDDIELSKGNLKNLCVSGSVTQPILHGGIQKKFHAHLFCIPRDIYEKVGGWDESFTGNFFEDSDWWMLLEKNNIPILTIDSVHILHNHPGRTIERVKNDDRINYNRMKFIEKWGIDALQKIL